MDVHCGSFPQQLVTHVHCFHVQQLAKNAMYEASLGAVLANSSKDLAGRQSNTFMQSACISLSMHPHPLCKKNHASDCAYILLSPPACRSSPQQTWLPQPGNPSPSSSPSHPSHVCKTFRLCHNSPGLAFTSVDVFAALEPLFSRLQLAPINDYVNLVELDDCLRDGCCCSTPVEVQLTLPMPAGAADVIISQVEEYLVKKLPEAISNVVCIGKLEDAQCAASTPMVAESRRRLV